MCRSEYQIEAHRAIIITPMPFRAQLISPLCYSDTKKKRSVASQKVLIVSRSNFLAAQGKISIK
jgi:hypothetical protein